MYRARGLAKRYNLVREGGRKDLECWHSRHLVIIMGDRGFCGVVFCCSRNTVQFRRRLA